jgi:DNA replication protein DnaD
MNFLYALLQAVGTDQTTLSWQQIADANATINDANIEQKIYSACNAKLTSDANAINNYVHNNDMSKQSNQAQLQVYNNQYQKDSTIAQTYQSQADGAVQSAQSQSGQDGQNLANKAQLAQTMTSILSTLSSVLMQHY